MRRTPITRSARQSVLPGGALAKNGTGEGMYKLLLAFQNFKPGLHWDRSSAWHADVGYEKWHISFSVRYSVSHGRRHR